MGGLQLLSSLTDVDPHALDWKLNPTRRPALESSHSPQARPLSRALLRRATGIPSRHHSARSAPPHPQTAADPPQHAACLQPQAICQNRPRHHKQRRVPCVLTRSELGGIILRGRARNRGWVANRDRWWAERGHPSLRKEVLPLIEVAVNTQSLREGPHTTSNGRLRVDVQCPQEVIFSA